MAQQLIINHVIPTAIPIQRARYYKSEDVWQELLLHTGIEKETVRWHGLRLLELNMSLMKAVKWVRRLKLAKNGLRSIPDDIGRYLRQVSLTSSTCIRSPVICLK